MRLDNGEVPSLRKAVAQRLRGSTRGLADSRDLGAPRSARATTGTLTGDRRRPGTADEAQDVWTARRRPRGDRRKGRRARSWSIRRRSATTGRSTGESTRSASERERSLRGEPAERQALPSISSPTSSSPASTAPPTSSRTSSAASPAGWSPPAPAAPRRAGWPASCRPGRNFYSIDIHTIPTETAWKVGVQAADRLIEKYLAENDGQYPRSIGIVVWGTSTMRTHGDDIAEILYLMGVRPVWVPESRRLKGIELIPLAELGRPRIDVTVRISGLLPRRLPQRHRPARQGRANSSPTPTSPTTATTSGPHVRRERRGLEAAGRLGRPGREAVALPRLRLEAGQLRRGPAEPDRRAELEERRRPGRGLHPLGLVRLHGDRPRRRRRRAVQAAAQPGLGRRPEPGQPRARHLRQRRLLPVPRRHDRRHPRPDRREPRRLLRRHRRTPTTSASATSPTRPAASSARGS